MPWCPICKMEYRDEYSTCCDCDTELISELETEPVKEIIHDEEVFLINVTDYIEAGMLESILNENGIPTLRKYKDMGSYSNLVMGKSLSGIDIYVPSMLYADAYEIIRETNIVESVIVKKENDEDEYFNKMSDKRTRLKQGLILLIIIPYIVFIILAIMKF